MMLSKKILAATTVAVCTTTGFAGTAGGAFDPASGSTSFGRADAVGAYAEAPTFTLAGISSPADTAGASALDSRNPDSSHAFVATRTDRAAPATLAVASEAVPEPGTYTFMLAGLGIVAFIALRRHRSRR